MDAVYGWIQDISVYLIVTAAVMHAVPGKDYGKYIRFFSGLVLILLVFTPMLKVMGMGDSFYTLYKGKEYEMDRREIEMAEEIFENSDMTGLLGTDPSLAEGNSGPGTEMSDAEDSSDINSATSQQEESRGRIKVEEIEIGE